MAFGLQAPLTAIWQSSTTPPWKRNGDQWDYSNYCAVVLLNILDKVLAHILLKDIRDNLLWHQRAF